jgi:hypothetical protein
MSKPTSCTVSEFLLGSFGIGHGQRDGLGRYEVQHCNNWFKLARLFNVLFNGEC